MGKANTMRTKQSIAWHEECLMHRLRFNTECKVKVMQALREIRERAEQNALYWRQIEEAKRLGWVAFDPNHPPRLPKK